MDPVSRLIRLRQGNRFIEDYVMEFCELCHVVDFNDVALKDILRFGLKQEISRLMPRQTPHWTLEQYIDFALRMSGSAFTVGIADEEPCYPPVSATPEYLHIMSGVVHKMAAIPEPVHKMATLPESAPVMAALPESAHVTSAKPQPAHAS